LQEITINPQEVMEFLIKYGIYIFPYLITQIIKKPFAIPKRWIPLVPFLISYLVVTCQIIETGTVLSPWQFGAKIAIEGSILGTVSVGARELWTKFFKRKEVN
jgi:hypothetical protein